MKKVEPGSGDVMTKNMKRVVVLLFLVVLSVAFFANGSKPETEFPQLSAEVNYADVKKRMEWRHDILQEGKGFHEYCNHPALERVRNAPNYETNLSFYYNYGKSKKEKLHLSTIMVNRKSLKRSPGVDIVFFDNGIIGFYKEFLLGRYVIVNIEKTGQLSHVSFEDFLGERKIQFDEDEKILSDTYQKFDRKRIQVRQENQQQIEEEIRDSIEAGYTDIQKRLPKEWQLKLPERIRDRTVRDRLSKIDEFHQATVAGDSYPLVENPVFDLDEAVLRANERIAPVNIRISYCGKNVAFVGVKKAENFRTIGYFIVYDEYFRLQKYVEGEIEFDPNLTGHETAKTAKLSLKDVGTDRNRRASGLEITFHPTGYPATYKTIVKERLFGRQMEWNDKGEVISDVDLDIPKPWVNHEER